MYLLINFNLVLTRVLYSHAQAVTMQQIKWNVEHSKTNFWINFNSLQSVQSQ